MRFKDDDVALCIMTFCAGEEVFRAGDRVRVGTTPAVNKHPEFWAPDDTPRSEWPDPQAEANAYLSQDPHPIRTPGISVVSVKLRAKKAVRVDVDGEIRKVKKGELLENNDLIAQLAPGSFERVEVEG